MSSGSSRRKVSTAMGVGMLLAGISIATVGSGEASAATAIVAAYEMNEGSSATVMSDSGPYGLDGAIGDDIVTNVYTAGARAYSWPWASPAKPPAKPGRIANVPSNSLLNPDDSDYAVEFRYKTQQRFGNVVQKGQNGSYGGYWKFEQPDGRMVCLFKDRNGRQRAVQSPYATNDGAWHVIRCELSDWGIRLFIDGSQVASRRTSMSTVANTKPLSIGGKTNCDQISVTCDYFTGQIDYVHIEKGGSTTAPPTTAPPTTAPPTTAPPTTAPPPPTGDVAFVSSASQSAWSRQPSVRLPTVEDGDLLVLFVATTSNVAIGEPSGSGWQPVGSAAGSKGRARVWQKVANAGDSNDLTRVTLSSGAKYNASALAYRGVTSVTAESSDVQQSSTAARATETVGVPEAGSMAVSYWMHRDSSTSSLTPPGSVETRVSQSMSGGGRPTVLIADSAGGVNGTYGGLVATAPSSSTFGITWTVILGPG